MKIDNQGLKALYQAYVRSNIPDSREQCPSAQSMVGLLRGRASRKKSTRLVDHISHCRYCAQEFEFLVEARRREKDLIHGVDQWLGRKDQEKIRPRLFSRFSWGLASLAAGFALIGLLLFKFLILPAPEAYRADSQAMIELIEPIDVRISRSSLTFRWKPLQDAEYYVLEIFDEALAPVWESEKISFSEAPPSREISANLASGRTYFWLVTAHFRGGEKIHSSLAEFALSE